jgi:hypothetical protein
MGFELYLRCYAGGQPFGLPRADVRALFPIEEKESKRDSWSIRYDGQNACRIGITAADSDGEEITSLCVDRPCSDLRLYEALLSILRMGSVVLYFPGEAPPLVASDSAVVDLPQDAIESLGRPKTVQSAEEILDIIRGA